jgi:hypothetical protein
MQIYLLILISLSGVLSQTFEWTALGDSYSSGVGAGDYVDGRRCLRYDSAYPALINGDPSLSPYPHIFNNVVCSGSTTKDVENYQFYETDQVDKPNLQYSPRPKFGDPAMATLSVGGNDIDFAGILFNCILETSPVLGSPLKTCPQQRSDTWALLSSPDLVNNIDHLIKKTVARGRAGSIGNDFRLYLTGFPEFFNAVDPGCDTVTFARTANPVPDGRDHVMLTTELRAEFNLMSDELNKAIQSAVSQNEDMNVKFIDIQTTDLDGHRFCEPGVKEPDQKNPNLWLFHYPYKQNEYADPPPELQMLINATIEITQGMNASTLGVKFPNISAYEDALWAAVDKNPLVGSDGDYDDLDPHIFWDGLIGARAKVFHPQVIYHSKIREYVLDQWLRDTQPVTAGTGPCVNVGSTFDPQVLRILPLGGSITWGQQSPSGNGYRKYLRDQLISSKDQTLFFSFRSSRLRVFQKVSRTFLGGSVGMLSHATMTCLNSYVDRY